MQKSHWFLMTLLTAGFLGFSGQAPAQTEITAASPDAALDAEAAPPAAAVSPSETAEPPADATVRAETIPPSADAAVPAPVPAPPPAALLPVDVPAPEVPPPAMAAAPPANVEIVSHADETLLDLPLGGLPPNGGEGAALPASNFISISLDAVPVPDVVNMFSRISGANIIVAGTYTNLYITANLKNVEWRSALNLALGSVNLSTIEDPSGIIMVVNSEMYQQKLKQIEETKPLVTRSFILRYMNAVDLVEQIKLLKILSPRGTIITSQSKVQHSANMKSSSLATTEIQNPGITTEVIVSDIREYVDRVETLIQKLDKREPQVFIEARIIDVVTSDSKKIGFDWSMLDRFGVTAGLTDLQWSFSDETEKVNTTDNQDHQYDRRSNVDKVEKFQNLAGQPYEKIDDEGNVTPTRAITDSIDTGRDISAKRSYLATDTSLETKMGTAFLTVSEASLFLSALKKNSNANMISHPLLIVGNKVEAKIHVGERYPTVFSEKTTDSSGGISRDSYSEKVEWNDLGLTLWVIPEIDPDANVVRMTVNPQMSTWVKDITTPQGSVYPVISTRHLSSRVNVPSTHTVVIGGLMEDSKSKKETRVPILGDIPLIGLLFRHTTDEVDRSNLLIMLTPTILDENEPLTGLEVLGRQAMAEFDYTPLDPKQAPAALGLAGPLAVSSNSAAEAAIAPTNAAAEAGASQPAP